MWLKIILALYLVSLRLTVPQRYKKDEAALLSLIKQIGAISKGKLLLCRRPQLLAGTESAQCFVLPFC